MALTVQPTAAQSQETVLTGVWPRALGWDNTYLWIANGFDSTVLRFNEGDDKIVDTSPIHVGSVPDSMPDAIAPDTFHHTVWVAGFNDFSLTVVDSTGKVQQTITGLAGHPVALTYAKTFMWVVEQNADSTGQDGLVQYDTTSYKALNTIKVGKFPTAIVASLSPTYIALPNGLPTNENLLWVANGGDDTITLIDITAPSKPATKTFSDGIPAFPISLAFDSANLWVGNYQNQVVKIDGLTGKPLPLTVPISGRLASVGANASYQDGNIWLITGDDATAIDMDSQAGTETGSNVRLQAVKGNVNSYAGAALATPQFVYVADWLNDRVVRFAVSQQIALKPTGTPAPATAAPTAAPTQAAGGCNMPPQLKPGDTGDVINDKFQDSVLIHKTPVLTKDTDTGQSFKVGEKFTVLDGPKVDPDHGNVCFYQVKSADGSKTGWIIQGGNPSDNPLRYYIEKSSS